MIGVNPPGNFLYSGAEIDQGIQRYSALCAQQPACRARTANLAASMQHTAAHMPSRWYFLPIKPGNVLVGTFMGLTEATAVDPPLSGPTDPRLVDLRRPGRPERPVAAIADGRYRPPPVVRLGRVCQHRDGRRAARRALLQLRRGPGLDHRKSPGGVLVGGRWPCARLAGQPGRGPVHQRAELERPDAAHRRARSTSKRRPRTPPRSCCRTSPTGTRSSCPGSGTRTTSSPTSRAPARSC